LQLVDDLFHSLRPLRDCDGLLADGIARDLSCERHLSIGDRNLNIFSLQLGI
jgi:hypothetical protein